MYRQSTTPNTSGDDDDENDDDTDAVDVLGRTRTVDYSVRLLCWFWSF